MADMAEEIAWLSAVDLLARCPAGTLSPVDVTESLLGRIEQSDPSGRPAAAPARSRDARS
jgi:hypothetical protein